MTKSEDQQSIGLYDVREARIAELRENYLPLKIEGIEDADGYKAVYAARQEVKKLRVAVEKRRKELKAPVLEQGKMIDRGAALIASQLEPIESHLLNEQKRVDAEKAALAAAKAKAEKEEAERAERERQKQVADRQQRLLAVGVTMTAFELGVLDDEEFEQLYASAKAQHEEAEAAKAQERADLEEARKRLDAEREELRKAQAEEAAKAKAEQERIEAERAELEREKREKEEAERKEAEARAAEAKRKAAAEREERLRPIRVRVGEFAEAVRGMAVPEGLPEDVGEELAGILQEAAEEMVSYAENLA